MMFSQSIKRTPLFLFRTPWAYSSRRYLMARTVNDGSVPNVCSEGLPLSVTPPVLVASADEYISSTHQEDDKPFTVSIPDNSFETYHLDPPPYTLETTKNELRQLYRDMMVIR
jgi:pyruvate dehydrogenase E1 component alpha subunit